MKTWIGVVFFVSIGSGLFAQKGYRYTASVSSPAATKRHAEKELAPEKYLEREKMHRAKQAYNAKRPLKPQRAEAEKLRNASTPKGTHKLRNWLFTGNRRGVHTR
jgi:hypothetical protein